MRGVSEFGRIRRAKVLPHVPLARYEHRHTMCQCVLLPRRWDLKASIFLAHRNSYSAMRGRIRWHTSFYR